MNQSDIKKAQRIIYLVTGYKKDALSETERKELETWIHLNSENLDLFNELTNGLEKDKALHIMDSYSVGISFKNLKARMIAEVRINKKKKIYTWIAAAAAIIIVISIGTYFIPQLIAGKVTPDLVVVHDVPPGSINLVTLTLADGRTVKLNDDKQMVISRANGLIYNDGTSVINEELNKEQKKNLDGDEDLEKQFFVINIPNGKQYRIVLSDGTKIWLNAASSLKYPASFTGNERKVMLTGEAYFEVAHNKDKPFKVISKGQEVKVLGTHFNINSYPDEDAVKTTLIEGSVMVSAISNVKGNDNDNTLVLKPNQQSIIAKNSEGIKVISVNPASALDWKNGDFIFDADIKTIMRQISRWYNIEVIYKGNITEEEFGGTVSRSKNLTEVLKVLQETNKVHFKLENASSPGSAKRVIVMP